MGSRREGWHRPNLLGRDVPMHSCVSAFLRDLSGPLARGTMWVGDTTYHPESGDEKIAHVDVAIRGKRGTAQEALAQAFQDSRILEVIGQYRGTIGPISPIPDFEVTTPEGTVLFPGVQSTVVITR